MSADVELALRALGRRLAEEPVVDLAPAVLARLDEPAAAMWRPRWRPFRAVLVGLAALTLLGGTALAASGDLRDALRDWLGSAGVELRRITPGSLPPPATIARQLPDLGLGEEVAPATAATELGTALPRVAALGEADAVLLDSTASGPVVSLVYLPRADLPAAPSVPAVGALLTVLPARDEGDPFVLAKRLMGDTVVEFTSTPTIGDAVWIAGVPHEVTLDDGEVERFRLAANVLLWRYGNRVFRLESALDQREALALADSVVAE